MAFTKGHKLSKGRPKGLPNKRTADFLDVLAKHNFCPATAMIETYNEAFTIYKSYSTIYAAIRQAKSNDAGYDVPLEDKCDKYLKIAGDMAKEISSYAYPKRKAIETTVDQAVLDAIKSLEGKTDQELLAILRASDISSKS